MSRHDPNGGLDYESPEDQARDDAELLARKRMSCPGYLAHGSSKLPCTTCGRLYDEHAAVLAFPGGEHEPRTPKPDELLLSAQQWVTRAQAELTDGGLPSAWPAYSACRVATAKSALDHALRALAELKGHV